MQTQKIEIQERQFIIDDFQRCGCYLKNPSQLQFKSDNVLVPLKNIDYQVEIIDSLSHITLIQTYLNPSDKFLELEYSFPRDPRNCIYKFVAQFGNYVVEGIVKEKKQAQQQYKKAVKAGKKAAYGQIDNDSSDIINLQIGNLPPKTQVKIIISFIQELEISMNTFYKLQIFGKVSPRYIMQGSQQPLISQKLKEQNFVKSGKANFTWNFKINLRSSKKIVNFKSSSHELQLLSSNEKESLLVMKKECIPNKDFVFYYTTENFHLPSYVLGRTDLSSTIMLSFIPKFCSLKVDDAYKAQIQHKTFDVDIQSAKAQFIFLLDRSGSMSGTSIQKAKQALILFLKSLPKDSYFNVVSFGSIYEVMFQKSLENKNASLQTAIKKVQKMNADMGGTQILDPLSYILNTKIIQGYPKQIFLLTDGEVSQPQRVQKQILNNIKYSRVHTIGIGNDVSSKLVIGCAQKGKGKHVFINNSQDCEEKIIQILSQSLSPVISQIDLKFDSSLVKSIIPNPKSIPYILKNQLINFYITFNGQIDKETRFDFGYTDSQNKLKYSTEIIVNPEAESFPFVDKMAHFKTIKNYEKTSKGQIKLEDHMHLYFVKQIDYKKAAIEQSIKNQILSEYTAFICIGKQLIDGQYQQFLNKQTQKIQISQPLPQSQDQHNKSFNDMDDAQKSNDNGQFHKYQMMQQCQEQNNIQFQDFYNFQQIKKCCDKKSSINRSSSCSRSRKSKSKKKKIQKWDQSSQSSSEKSPIKINQSIMKRKQPEEQTQKQTIKNNKMIRKQLQKQSEKLEKSKDSLIKQIISMQNSQGFWSDQNIILELFSSSQLQQIENLSKQYENQIIKTYVIALWIQKNFSGKKYSLLIKKAFSWCKNTSNSKGFNFQDIDTEVRKVLSNI